MNFFRSAPKMFYYAPKMFYYAPITFYYASICYYAFNVYYAQNYASRIRQGLASMQSAWVWQTSSFALVQAPIAYNNPTTNREGRKQR